VSHELVRHRLASYSQESTRWCNYSGEVTFIIPPWIDIEQGTYIWPHVAINIKDKPVELWFNTILEIEKNYQWLISVGGWKPEQARSVLPNSLKTEIVMTANLREWRHVFQQRCDENAHPQMRELMIPLLNEFKQIIPVVFDDLEFA
jgi:thymidylate synthase (FAD)